MKMSFFKREDHSVYLLGLSLVALPFCASGQVPQTTNAWAAPDSAPYAATEIDANHCVWSKAVPVGTNASGEVIYQIASYTELQTGGWYLNSGQWLPSQEVIEVTPQGGAARHGSYQASFAGNINNSTAGAVSLATPDQKTLAMSPMGISYYDASTGSNVWIALIQDSQGYILPSSNQVVWPSCYSGLDASIRWTYTKAAAEEDIILKQRPPDPATTFGMNPANVKIQAWCEFIGPPTPEIRQTRSGNDTDDELLSFGVMQIPQGKAFLLEDESALVPVRKHWTQIEGRTFLVEEIDFSSVAAQLQTLPESASADTHNGQGQALLHKVTPGAVLPARLLAKKNRESLKLAKTVPKEKGFVLDFTTLSSAANTTLISGTTYYVSSTVNLSGTTVCEGGVVIKFGTNANSTINFTGPVNWQGASFFPVLCTARDDDVVGDAITGSTHSPTNYYATVALNFNTGTNVTLQNLRVAYAKTAIGLNGNTNHVFSHVQLVNCQNGFSATNADYSVRNALFWNVLTNFTGSSSTGRVEHLTVDTADHLNDNSQTLFLTNCLLVAITNASSFTSNTVSSVSSTNGIFQVVGAGFHYLAGGSPYRDAGTTNINPALATALGQMTTWPPLVFSNNFTINTTLWPQAQRDSGNGAYDLGWHYDPLDYCWGTNNLTNSATLILTNGVAIGFTGKGVKGTTLQNGTSFISQGTPNNFNHLTHYFDVQEQEVLWGSGSIGTAVFVGSDGGGTGLTTVKLRFTDAAALPVPTWPTAAFSLIGATLSVQDCQFRNANVTLNDSATATVTAGLTNNTFVRSTATFSQQVNNPYWLYLYNNLYQRSTVTLNFNKPDPFPQWWVFNNLFDRDTLSVSSGGVFPVASNNAYFSCSWTLGPSGSTADVTLTNVDFQTGPLGNYYYPTNGGMLSTLINAGNTTADLLGLYHYTTTTNQVKETNSIVDIGFHYVAVGTNGLPLDTDGNGSPDYLADANGNGKVDSGEMSWTNAADLGLKVLITRPKNNSVIP
jgi:hypothetical protein